MAKTALSKRLPYATFLLVLVLLALPAVTPAQPPPPRAVQITLHGTHGYGIEVSGKVAGDHSIVTLSAGRPFSTAGYSVRGTITPTRVRASFGTLGSVSLRLAHYRTQKVTLPKSCRLPGHSAVSDVRVGTFVGHIRFHGDRGFTSGSARRVRGAVGDPTAIFLATGPDPHIKLFCLGGPGSGSGKTEPPSPVALQARSSDGAISFLALSPARSTSGANASTSIGYAPLPHGPTTFVAGEAERRGRVQISRSVTATAPSADFIFDNALSTATVTPPAPFSGPATFQRGADGSITWTGSLAVSFPGLPDVALAGPQFTASLGNEHQISGESCAEYPGNRPCS